MKSLKTWILLTEASADATTFFHEVICGIACHDDSATGAAGIERGADILKFFTSGVIAAMNPSGNAITDIESQPFYKWIDNTTKEVPPTAPPSIELKSEEATKAHFDKLGMKARATDAIAVAKAVTARIGNPTTSGPVVYWTGPTNDKTSYGAADIVYNDQGISLKYGTGQFKSLTVNQFARAALGKGDETELLTMLHDEVPDKWNDMTSNWLDLIQQALKNWKHPRVGGKKVEEEDGGSGRTRDEALEEAKDLFSDWKMGVAGNWGKYQKKRISWKEVQVFHDLLFVPKKKSVYNYNDKKGDKDRVKQFRYVCRKIHDQGTQTGNIRKAWKVTRTDSFDKIFKTYFDNQDATIKKNLATVFERQISVSAKPMIYAGKGGTDIRRVPSKEEFDHSIDNIAFSHEGKMTGSGYTFILLAQLDPLDPIEKIMEITIYFRFKAGGQMVGNPDTSSKAEMFVTDYTDAFPGKDSW